MTTLLVLGPAGSGKSTLSRALYENAKKNRTQSKIIACNLDPGALDTSPWDIDIRKRFTIENIMKNYGLGPNGAVEKAYELLSDTVDSLFGPVDHSSSDFTVLDAPGQLEPLIFSDAGNKLLDRLKMLFSDMVGVFLLPGNIVNEPTNFAFVLLTLTGLHLKIHIPILYVISKADLLLPSTAQYINNGQALKDIISRDFQGEISEFTINAINNIENLLPKIHMVKISITGYKITGLDDLLDLLDEIRCSCGDLT